MRKEFAILNHQLNPRTVHVYNAPGADIEMADLAVPHLSLGEPNERAAGVDQRIGILAQQPGVGGLAGESNSVGFGFGSASPAIENDHNEWFRSRNTCLPVLHKEIKRTSLRQQHKDSS